MRYLIEELITQRFVGARLSIELAEARIEAIQVKEISVQPSYPGAGGRSLSFLPHRSGWSSGFLTKFE